MKQMIGRYYSIDKDGVICTYLCPYCEQETVVAVDFTGDEMRNIVERES